MKLKKSYFIAAAGLGLILSGAAVYYLTKDDRPQKAAEEIARLSQNVRRFYANRPGYWGLNTEAAASNRLFPAESMQNGVCLNAFGKPVKLGKGKGAVKITPGLRGFDIIWEGLTAGECVAAATYPYAQDFLYGVTGVTIDNGTKSADFGWGEEEILPLSKKQAASVCQGNQIYLIWHME